MIIQGIPEIDRIVLFLLIVLFTSSNSHSLLPNLRVDILRVAPVAFFTADFNLSSCESENFTFTLLC